MDFYSGRISTRIGDLLLAVVAIGILVVSVEYVQILLSPDKRQALDASCLTGATHCLWQDFANRVVLVLLVIAFSAYTFIAYAAYWPADPPSQDGEHDGQMLSPGRMLAMYLLDLAQVTIAAWMFAILLTGDLTGLPSSAANTFTEAIELSLKLILFLFVLAALWHVTVALWYFIRHFSSLVRDIKLHGGFCIAYLAGIAVIYAGLDWRQAHPYFKWGATIYFALLIMLLYRLQAYPYLKRQQKHYKNMTTAAG